MRIYSIPPDMPFLEELARAILKGDLPVADGTPPGPLDLPRWTILLPTRRAARAMTDAFLKAGGGAAMLLPRIRPIGDVDEDEMMLSPPGAFGGDGRLALELPPAIGNLERRLVLSRLILKWSAAMREGAEARDDLLEELAPASTPAQASLWAKELMALMDSTETEEADLGRLENLTGGDYASHWQLTLEFLTILTEHWPAHLAEHGQMSPYARSEKLIREAASRLAASPPAAPVIAAGSTGTRPATAALLEAVAGLPNGAVVLPGLDVALDDKSWEAVAGGEGHPEHPQFGLAQLLRRLGAGRGDVLPLGSGEQNISPRAKLVSEVMRPAGSTAKWAVYAAETPADACQRAIEGITRIDAPTAQMEAEAVSLILRHAMEEEGRTAALVTPDRRLARRVAARLEKWGLQIDDSAGRPLASTQAGTFMDLIAETLDAGFAPVTLMALLKHPLTRLGRAAGGARAAARALELNALRQPFPGIGIQAMRKQLENAGERARTDERLSGAAKRRRVKDIEAALALLGDIEAAFAPLAALTETAPWTIGVFARAHAETAEALAKDESGQSKTLWQGDEGEALSLLFTGMITEDSHGPEIALPDYPEFYRSLVVGQAVRPRAPAHPRLFIWGPLEARLQRPDVVVLGGLNDDTWPAAQETGPWLSRPMMAELGLPSPERRIGLSAHDVSQLMGVERVYLTRSEKVDGAPAVPSRWLLRLEAILAALGCKDNVRDDLWLGWAAKRDDVAPAEPVPRPAPCPPVQARPKRFSVTRIETWIANPYAVFARDILRLRKLDPLRAEADSRLRGVVVHDVLNAFSKAHPARLPEKIADEFMRLAEAELKQAGASPVVLAFWRPHLVHFARWFAASEPERRAGVARVHAEIGGELELADLGFTLTARADRIDAGEDGLLRIYDYKTGTVPTKKKVADLRAPQLPLEAAMAAEGAFADVPEGEAAALRYIRFLGRGEGGSELDIGGDPGPLAREAMEKLKSLVADYSRAEQAYEPLRRAAFGDSAAYRYDDYAHLARIAEWSVTGRGGE